MPDRLAARSALHGLASPGRFGRATGTAGLVIAERSGLALASVIAGNRKGGAVVSALAQRHGVEPHDSSRRVANSEVAFIGCGPRQWIAIAEPPAAADFVAGLQTTLEGLAAVSDQSDGRVVIRLSGAHVRDVLAKGVPIDLDPRAFGPDDAAVTLAAHIGVHLWQRDAQPTYELMAFRSLAGSLWSWLTASAAEFGYEVVADTADGLD